MFGQEKLEISSIMNINLCALLRKDDTLNYILLRNYETCYTESTLINNYT